MDFPAPGAMARLYMPNLATSAHSFLLLYFQS